MTMILTRVIVFPRAGKPNFLRAILVASMGHVNRALVRFLGSHRVITSIAIATRGVARK
jgi:hypothetical protein